MTKKSSDRNQPDSGDTPTINENSEQKKMLDAMDQLAESVKPVKAPPVEPIAFPKSARNTKPGNRGNQARKPRRRIPWTMLSFLLFVIVPTAATNVYYAIIASPQYVSETQFSVRGSSQNGMSGLGLTSLLGNSVQSNDSYIVTSYIESLQLLHDLQKEQNLDLRKFYSTDKIDWLYRVDPNKPLDEFINDWRSLVEVSFNSTTGNVTMYVYAFSAADAKLINEAVMKAAVTLVNRLSEESRDQMTTVASKQVDRAEERLRNIRESMRKLRVEEKAFDPGQIAQIENNMTATLENQLQALKTRQTALLQVVSKDAPSARVLARQISALEKQLEFQHSKLGTDGVDPATQNQSAPSSNGVEVKGERTNLAGVINKFEELNVELGFATQAYTTSMAGFESALAEAQKQDRYFATFVAPTMPEVSLHPNRPLNGFIAFLIFLAIWIFGQFLYRSFRDHAI